MMGVENCGMECPFIACFYEGYNFMKVKEVVIDAKDEFDGLVS